LIKNSNVYEAIHHFKLLKLVIFCLLINTVSKINTPYTIIIHLNTLKQFQIWKQSTLLDIKNSVIFFELIINTVRKKYSIYQNTLLTSNTSLKKLNQQ
jgi:branched-subunit amino acid transport protein AzlD